MVKKDTRSMMRKELGKKADAILKKLRTMLKQGASHSAIEKMVAKALREYEGATIAVARESIGDIRP
jgi:hypothetical protein